MDLEKLVDKYIDAWNRQDVAGILELLHAGAAIYDAFWMETVVGRDLSKYLQDSIDEQNYWYQVIGEVILVDHGVAFRYSAHERSDTTIGPELFSGAEVLIVHDNKILTVSTHYCMPDRAALIEVAELAAKRHGLPSHPRPGLSAQKMLRFKAELSAAISQDKIFLDPHLTMSQLADRIGCSTDQLSLVIESQYGTSFDSLLENQRAEHAKRLLQGLSDTESNSTLH